MNETIRVEGVFLKNDHPCLDLKTVNVRQKCKLCDLEGEKEFEHQIPPSDLASQPKSWCVSSIKEETTRP